MDDYSNIQLRDSYVISNYKVGSGSGEAKLYLNEEKFNVFFDDLSRNFFFLKVDFSKYLIDIKDYFLYPKRNHRRKDQMPSIYSDILNNLNTYDEEFMEFIMVDPNVTHSGAYLNSSSSYYDLMRSMALPLISYLSFLKLKNQNGEISYYARLFMNDSIPTIDKLEKYLTNFEINDDTIKQISASLNAGQNIILNGIPGTGKTHLATIFAEEAMGEDGFILTTATSDWTTFDTIGGLMPNKEGELEFHEGKFLQAIRENKWLIIDEINRADIDKAFGQLFTVLSGHDVELPYEDVEGNPIKIVINKNLHMNQYVDGTYYIGKDWRIIGTMNSYDKNTLFDLSYAFMRRFMFVEIEVPNSFDFADEFKNENNDKDKINNTYYEKLKKLYGINTCSEIKTKYKINRKLGPAIFLDVFSYIISRSKLSGNYDYNSQILADAINAYAIPQFEGLGKKINEVKKFIELEVFKEENDKEGWGLVKNKLEDLEPKRFKN